MYVEMMITECDFTEKRYNGATMGAGVLAQGATGRWCVVMTVGPDYIKKHDVKVLSRKEAEVECLNVLKTQNLQRPEGEQYPEGDLAMWIDF